MAYNDSAVFLPGDGRVFTAPVGTAAPTYQALKTFVQGGMTGTLTGWEPIGYTSLDSLPSFESDTEGGDVLGVFENKQFRTSAITINETIKVTHVQWSEVPMKHRFGGAGSVKAADGTFATPDTYTGTECALLVLLVDGNEPMGFTYARVVSAPDDSVEVDTEKFLGMPVKYTVLKATGKPRLTITAKGLTTTTTAGS